ncbi:hypothetical protein ACTMU2_09250 [Cupriavidus basilensis]
MRTTRSVTGPACAKKAEAWDKYQQLPEDQKKARRGRACAAPARRGQRVAQRQATAQRYRPPDPPGEEVRGRSGQAGFGRGAQGKHRRCVRDRSRTDAAGDGSEPPAATPAVTEAGSEAAAAQADGTIRQ